MLQTLNHPQPPTQIKTDNSIANDFVSKNLKQKRSKYWDMSYHWLRDRCYQNQFKVFWDKGANTWADYFTKHYSINYHKIMCPKYINMANYINKMKPKIGTRHGLREGVLNHRPIQTSNKGIYITDIYRRYIRVYTYEKNYCRRSFYEKL